MGSAVETLCGQAYGARKYVMLGVYMQRSTVLLMATGLPLMIVSLLSKQLLLLLGESERVASAAVLDVGVAHLSDVAGVVCVRMGAAGAGLVLSVSWWIIVVAQFVYIVTSDRCKATWGGFSWMAFTGLWDFFKLSAASAVMLFLETWYFQILVLIAGLLPDPEIELDSLTVCSTLLCGAWDLLLPFYVTSSIAFMD
ncbi:UNVERIFIED_CONTAM: protein DETOXIFICATION 40 [Sesamum latifolium]|uniref:Protein DETOXIFICATION 40 n=1 Tax=Sesamum latifolium TaxID=2727402 RepID=A0AAW2WRI5_9LAMI